MQYKKYILSLLLILSSTKALSYDPFGRTDFATFMIGMTPICMAYSISSLLAVVGLNYKYNEKKPKIAKNLLIAAAVIAIPTTVILASWAGSNIYKDYLDHK